MEGILPTRGSSLWSRLPRRRKPGPEAKVKAIHDFARELACREIRSRRLVHCHGVFDLLHIGHIRHLREARALGDHLVVTLTPDHLVNKGPHRPAFPQAQRAEALASLECVDTVCINEWPTAVEAIRLIQPTVFIKGVVAGDGPRDRNAAIDSERQAVESVGGRMVLTDTELHSASALINQHTDVFAPELKAFLQAVREQTTAAALVSRIARFDSLRVEVVGSPAIARALEPFCTSVTGGRGEAEPVDLAIVHQTGTQPLEAQARTQLRARARFLAVDLGDVRAPMLEAWSESQPDLVVCNEPAAAASAGRFATTIGICANGDLVVRERTRAGRLEVPAFPVNPINRVDGEGEREAIAGFASAAGACGLSSLAVGLVANLAAAAATTVAGQGAIDPVSLYRQIDSVLKAADPVEVNT